MWPTALLQPSVPIWPKAAKLDESLGVEKIRLPSALIPSHSVTSSFPIS